MTSFVKIENHIREQPHIYLCRSTEAIVRFLRCECGLKRNWILISVKFNFTFYTADNICLIHTYRELPKMFRRFEGISAI